MDISYRNNQSFEGAFVLKSVAKKHISALNELIPKHKVLFDDCPKQKSILLITRDSKDKIVADYITKYGMKFEYYPDINTSSPGSQNAKSAMELINQSINKITSFIKLRDLFKPVEKVNRFDIGHVLRYMDVKPEEVTKQSSKGVIHIFKNGEMIAKVSPQGQFGLNFLYIKPKNLDASPIRCAIDKEGNEVVRYNSIEGIKQFYLNMASAVEFNKPHPKKVQTV